MHGFAVYTHTQIAETSKPPEQIRFIGHSYPYFSGLFQKLQAALTQYPQLPLRQADYAHYLSVHTPAYLETLLRMAADEPLQQLPKLSAECTGLEYCLPGYLYGLGGMLEAIDQMRIGRLDRTYHLCLGGHHAYADWGHGYCLLNSLAAACLLPQHS